MFKNVRSPLRIWRLDIALVASGSPGAGKRPPPCRPAAAACLPRIRSSRPSAGAALHAAGRPGLVPVPTSPVSDCVVPARAPGRRHDGLRVRHHARSRDRAPSPPPRPAHTCPRRPRFRSFRCRLGDAMSVFTRPRDGMAPSGEDCVVWPGSPSTCSHRGLSRAAWRGHGVCRGGLGLGGAGAPGQARTRCCWGAGKSGEEACTKPSTPPGPEAWLVVPTLPHPPSLCTSG